MNTHDIELPPLPSPFGIVEPVGNEGLMHYTIRDLQDYAKAYARTAIEADRKRRGEPVGYISQEKFEFLKAPDRDKTAGCMAIIDKSASSACAVPLYAAPQPAEPGEVQPVDIEKRNATVTLYFESAEAASRWFGRANNEIELRENAEPVKVPSDEEIRELSHEFSGMTYEDLDVVGFGRALLDRYGKGAP